MLEIRNLSKTYSNGVQALRQVDLDIPTGMFGLLGPNGAGKSTLMRTVATLQEPDEGSVRLGEIDVLSQKDAIRQLLGYLPQDFGVYPNVSAEMLLTHFATLKGISGRRERKQLVDAVFARTNLYDVRKERLGSFSGGMKQRFGIAQALLGNPGLIIVDEPTAGLDPEERNRFLDLLSEIGENVVVILSTHIVDDVSDVCSKMAIIADGRLLLTGEPERAIAGLRGRTWRKRIEKHELDDYRERYTVISTRLFAGKTVIHVLDEKEPDPSFDPVEPGLDDVYFTTLARSA